jgi:hypothetical protein
MQKKRNNRSGTRRQAGRLSPGAWLEPGYGTPVWKIQMWPAWSLRATRFPSGEMAKAAISGRSSGTV